MSREIITISQVASMTLLEILEVEPICKFCGCEITKENFGVLFNKPIIVVCNDLSCMYNFYDEIKG